MTKVIKEERNERGQNIEIKYSDGSYKKFCYDNKGNIILNILGGNDNE